METGVAAERVGQTGHMAIVGPTKPGQRLQTSGGDHCTRRGQVEVACSIQCGGLPQGPTTCCQDWVEHEQKDIRRAPLDQVKILGGNEAWEGQSGDHWLVGESHRCFSLASSFQTCSFQRTLGNPTAAQNPCPLYAKLWVAT